MGQFVPTPPNATLVYGRVRARDMVCFFSLNYNSKGTQLGNSKYAYFINKKAAGLMVQLISKHLVVEEVSVIVEKRLCSIVMQLVAHSLHVSHAYVISKLTEL